MDSNERVVTYDEIILKYNLLFNSDVSNNILNDINIETSFYNLYNKVLKYISIKMRSKMEIERYLEMLKVDIIDKRKIIKKLNEMGLINDKKYAISYIADKMRLSNDGPNKIKNDLLRYNIDINIIEEELYNYDENFIYEKLNKIIIKKIRINNKY